MTKLSSIKIPKRNGTPTNPETGFVKIYVKIADGKVYILNDAGIETEVGRAGIETSQATVESPINNESDKFVSARRFWQGIISFLSYSWTWVAKQTFSVAPRLTGFNTKYIKTNADGDIEGLDQIPVADINGLVMPNVTASNGLTKTGDNIKHGGTLTENTSLNGAVRYQLGLTTLLERFTAAASNFVQLVAPDIQLSKSDGNASIQIANGGLTISWGSSGTSFCQILIDNNRINFFSTANGGATSSTLQINKNGTIAFFGTVSGITKAMVGLGNVDNTSDSSKPISALQQAALNLKADLVGGVVPSAQLPPTVDEILEYTNLAGFPATGETNKYYLALDTNKTYRWSGSVYTPMNEGIALGETSSTAYRGDRGKTAYDHTFLTNNPHGVTKAQVGLGNVDNTSDNNKPVSTLQAAADSLRQLLSEKNAANGYVGLDANQQIRLGTSVIPSATTLIMTGSGNVIQVSGTTEIVTIPAPTNTTFLYLIGNPSANLLISNAGNVRSITGEKIRITAGICLHLTWNPYDLVWEQVNILASQFVDTNVYRTGKAYSIVAKGKFTGGTVNLGTTMKAYPFVLENDFEVSEMRINVTTAIASSFIRMGIYELDADFYPTVPLFLSGEINSATTGVKNIPTSSFSFQANKYYGLVIQASITGVLLRSVDDSNLPFILGDDPAMGTAPNTNWSVTRTYAALPDPFTAGGTLNSTDMPNLLGIAV
jgi:hypothetical protein